MNIFSYEIPYFDITIYQLLFWFIAYSVMGWFVESVYMSICNHKITNRGFIHGPFCPIYGVGGVGVHLALSIFAGNYAALYVAGCIFATTLEFCTAKLMIRFLGYVWWDYSNKKMNYKSIICLESTLAWGLYTVLEFTIFHEVVFGVMDHIPERVGKYVIVMIVVYYLFDFAYTLLHVKKGEVEGEENNLLCVRDSEES